MGLPRLLCVDDEPDVLSGLSLVLRGKYEVELAGGGEEGLRRLAEARRVDLIISDLQMPGMDGVEFLERAREAAPLVPRLLLTGHGSVSMAAAAVNRGAISRFLLKPCEPAVLLQAVADALADAARAAEERAELQRRADEVFQRLVEAERRATLGALAGAIGNELSNVTIAFDAALDMMADTARGGQPARAEEIDILRRVGEHLASHGQSLRRLGERGLEPASTADLVGCISGALDLLRFSGVLRHAKVDLDLPRDPVLVPLSRTRAEQVVVSLLRNAAAAMEEMENRPARVALRIGAAPGGREVVLSVEDNGGGMSQEKLDRLFDPSSYYGAGRRRGLGLFVVKHLVESRRGRLEVTSREGRGTTVTVTLPVVAPEPR